MVGNESKLASYLKGKSVCLVGGATSFCLEEMKKYDVVARVNAHYWTQGGRCNVLYTRIISPKGLDRMEHIRLKPPKFVVLEARKKRIAEQYLNKDSINRVYIGFGGLTQSKANRAEPLATEAKIDNPLAGMVAFNHLLKQEVRELHVTGMDFYDGKEDPNNIGHQANKHLSWFIEKCATDKRVTLDDTLKAVCS